MAAATQFIGSKISLISKSEIRYEGILYSLDLVEATISLAKVKSFGTEDRPTTRPVQPKEEVYEFIIFRGTDIKGIDVIEPPDSVDDAPVDPAIVEVSSAKEVAEAPPASVAPPLLKQPTDQQQQQRHPQQQQQQQHRQQQHHGQGEGQQQYNRERPPQQRQQQHNQHPEPRGQQQHGGEQLQQRGPHRDQQQQQHMDHHRGGGHGGGGEHRGGGHHVPRGGYYNQARGGGRGGFQRYRGAPQGQPRYQNNMPKSAEKLKYQQEFDFEKANEELNSVFEKIKIEAAEEPAEAEAEETVFYQKDNFFDNISCEALESRDRTRPDWKAERKLNAETFGLSGRGRGRFQRRGYNNYRGGGGYYGGYYNRGRGQSQNQNQNNNGGGGGF